MRVGFGYDVHRLVPDRPCILGGVNIPNAKGPLGHSDADVLLHAIADAILGAAALGDIGKHFPDTDPKFKGIASTVLLRHVAALLAEHGYSLINVDATLVAEEPRIGPHVEAMQRNISNALGISPNSVGIKATTNEGIGTIGRGEGIAAFAVALVEPRSTGNKAS